MRAGFVKHLPWRVLAVVALTALLIPVSAWTQQSATPEKPQTPGPDPQRDGDRTDSRLSEESSSKLPEESSSQGSTIAPVVTNLPPLRELGRARSLQATQRSPLQVGPIYVSSASYLHAMGNGLQFNEQTNVVGSRRSTADFFRTSLVLDHYFSRKRLTFQYQPQLVIFNGQVLQDLSSHSFTFDTEFLLSPRMSLAVSDSYSSVNYKYLTGDFAVDSDFTSGNTANKAFLVNPTRFVSDNLSVTLNYQMSPRDVLAVRPKFHYEHTSISGLPTSSFGYGSEVSWNRTLDQRRSVGVTYTAEERKFNRVLSNTFLQSLSGNYSYRWSSQWLVSGSLGAGTDTDNSRRRWTVTGGASLIRNFRRSEMAVVYYRGYSVGGPFITNRETDRIDVGYSTQLSQRWRVGTSFGHQGENTIPNNLSGYYAAAQTAFRLTPRVSWVANLGYRWLQGGNVLLSGSLGHYFFSTGITWDSQRQGSY